MDRKIFKLPFTKTSPHDWQCPTCQKGLLRIKNGTFFDEETSLSKSAHTHDDWDPEWISSVYSCLLVCSNDACKETVATVGESFVDRDFEYEKNTHFQQMYHCEFLKPLFFQPHLKLISIPKSTPDKVIVKLNESFKLFFSSPSAASNHVRAAVEELLNALDIEMCNGNNKLIPLHKRIDLLPSEYIELKDFFFAVKWLGNAGSHSGKDLTADDVMDAYEMIEHVLSEIYDNKSIKLKALAQEINEAKGPKG